MLTNLRADVAALATPAGRKVGTPGHGAARRYLLRRLAELDLEPYRPEGFDLPYQSGRQDFHNLVGMVPGRERELAPLVIGAHYDSVLEAPCADDNAAAVAIALAAAAALRGRRPRRDVLFALFDAEEPPYFLSPSMGSVRFYADHAPAAGFHAAVVMDLVGHDVPLPAAEFASVLPRFGELLFVTGAESHPALPGVVAGCRPASGLAVAAAQNRLAGDLSDHHVFRTHGVPYLFLSCGRWEHYHSETDTPDRLSYAKMARIAEYLVCLADWLAAADLAPAAEADTTAWEIGMLRDALGPGLSVLLASLGLGRLETRRDFDALAARLQAYFRL